MTTRPRPLLPGARIAVVAPASPPRDPERLRTGIAHLEKSGYVVETARSTFEPHGYLCGTDEVRLTELNDVLRRDDVDALFCVRGGYGTLRLLEGIDYEAARAHPKLVVGYSDITALHLALLARSGLRGLSGPMVAVEWGTPDPESERLFWELARGGTPAPLLGPGREALLPVRPGKVEGMLVGGNLTLITRLIGTPYLPSLDGALLFLEEVGEQPYRIDGLFAQLHLTGILERLGGLILGRFTEAEPESGLPSLSVEEVLADYTRELPFPVARGLVYGHFPVKNTLPIGVRARLSVSSEAAELHVLEPVVALA